MTTFVSLTSQGQLSIPASFRRALQIQIPQKVSITLRDGEIVIRPVRKLSDLAGCLQNKALVSPLVDHSAFEDFVAHDAANDQADSSI